MSRDWRCSVVVALATVGVMLPGCSSDSGPSTPSGPAVGPSYVYGEFQGSLSNALNQVFAPMEWSGQTDGPVLVSADKLLTLSGDQEAALRMVLSEGHAILVSEVTAEHIERLHAVNRSVPAISLDPSTADPAALYVLSRPQGLTRVFVVQSYPDDGSGSADLEAAKKEHAEQVAQWFLEQRALHTARSTALTRTTYLEGDADASVSDTFPFSLTLGGRMAAAYSNQCDTPTSCSNYDPITISAVAVHDPSPDPGQPGDWIIGRLDGTFNSANCRLALGTQNYWQNNRWAGYWTRQANMGAAVKSPLVYADLTTFDILKDASGGLLIETLNNKYAPIAANPTETRTKGVEWGIGASGTVSAGVSSKDGASIKGSMGFSGGVSYSNTSTQEFQVVETIPHVWEDESNPTRVGWTLDSWNHVKATIKPANHGCGGPGLDIRTALPAEIYGGPLSPHAEWVWALNPTVRTALERMPTRRAAGAYVYLPVDVTGSVLMGWTFLPAIDGNFCRVDKSLSLGRYEITSSADYIDVVGVSTAPVNGLAFDPGCGTEIVFGTIPLGSWTAKTRDGSNVGTPYSLGSLTVNIPLAPNPRMMTLARVCVKVRLPDGSEECREPAAGLMGAEVVLTGKNVQTATHATFGGVKVPASVWWSGNPDDDAVVTVIAPPPNLTVPIPPEGHPVAVALVNAVGSSGGFQFTYMNH